MKVAVLFGGASSERDVSVASAAQVIAALRSRGHEVTAVDARTGPLTTEDEERDLRGQINRLPPADRLSDGQELPALVAGNGLKGFDLVFLAMHGGAGEDGTLQTLLALAGIQFTGSNAFGSGLAMDKDVAKRLFVMSGVPTPGWLMVPADRQQIEEQLGYPLIVKPNSEGSTVGLSLVTDPDQLDEAIALAAQFDEEVMLEQFIPGREFTVGVLDGVALAVGEMIPESGEIFDYAAKYQSDAAAEIFPADIDPVAAERARSLALCAHRALKLSSYSRADFRMDSEGALWCLEVNTLPGMTAGSLLPQSAQAAGIEFPALCERICELACRDDADGQ